MIKINLFCDAITDLRIVCILVPLANDDNILMWKL